MEPKVWILLHATWHCPEDETPAWAQVFSSKDMALRWLYGGHGSGNPASLQWRRSAHNPAYFAAVDPLEPDGQWWLYGHALDEEVEADWRRFGFTGELPDLDSAPTEWPEDEAQ